MCQVPKAIMFNMVNQVKENFHNELVSTLYSDETITDLMREPTEVLPYPLTRHSSLIQPLIPTDGPTPKDHS